MLAISVTMIPSSSETMIVRVLKMRPLFGQREPDRVEELEQPDREREAEEQPDDRRQRAHHERLDDDREAHLATRCAERPQRRELARALGDRDRERVEDDERADEQRDHTEREQEVAEERDERVGVLRVLGRLLRRRCAPACPSGRIALISETSCACETPGLPATRI